MPTNPAEALANPSLSKREVAAIQICAAIVAKCGPNIEPAPTMAATACQLADALLEELSK